MSSTQTQTQVVKESTVTHAHSINKAGTLLDFTSFDVERSSSRIFAPIPWLMINGPALLIALMTYSIWNALGDKENLICWQNAFLLYAIGTAKGYIYIVVLYFVFKNKRKYYTQIHQEMEDKRSFWGHVFWCSVRSSFSAIFLEIFNTFGVFYFYGVDDGAIWYSSPLLAAVLFIAKFFCWEVWFDFGHYWGHRGAHIFKPLFEFGHIVHHESLSPDAFDGLNITFDDAVLTNFVPHMLSHFMMTKVFGFSTFGAAEYHVMASYKTFVEVSGHVGVDFRGRSFPLLPFIPNLLGIDIGTAAYHSLHHLYCKFNFSKRFNLWDRVFGTMMIPPVMQTGSKKEMLQKYKPLLKGSKSK